MADDLRPSLEHLCDQIQRLQVRLSDVRWARPSNSTVPLDGENEESTSPLTRVYSFDSPEANLILKAIDGVEFRVFRRILSEGSKFFQTMLSLPSGGSHPSLSEDQLPIIDIAENSHTFSEVLQFLYPVPDPLVQSLGQLNELLSIALKYDMPGVQHSLRNQLVSQPFSTSDPFTAFTIAVRHQLVDEIKLTAGWTFSVSLLEMPLTDDHRYITGYEFFQLVKLHRRRAKEFNDIIKAYGSTIKCQGCSRRDDDQSSVWWKDWESRAFVEIQKRPCTKIVFSPTFISKSAKAAIESRNPCYDCPLHMHTSQASMESLRMKLDSLTVAL